MIHKNKTQETIKYIYHCKVNPKHLTMFNGSKKLVVTTQNTKKYLIV